MVGRIFEAALFFVYAVFFLLLALVGFKILKGDDETKSIVGTQDEEAYRLVTWLAAGMSTVGFYTGILLICEAATMWKGV